MTSIISYIAHHDVDLHDKLRRDITAFTSAKAGSIGAIRLYVMQMAALMEVLFPVKYITFSTEHNLMEINVSDPFTFNSWYSDEIKPLTQIVVLKILILSGTHVHKIVVNIKSGTGTFVKGKHALLN